MASQEEIEATVSRLLTAQQGAFQQAMAVGAQ